MVWFLQWAKINDVNGELYNSYYRVCGMYFFQDLIKPNVSGKRYLVTNSIPTLNDLHLNESLSSLISKDPFIFDDTEVSHCQIEVLDLSSTSKNKKSSLLELEKGTNINI